MNWYTPFLVLGLAYGLHHALKYRDWLDWSKNDIIKTSPGPCTTVIKVNKTMRKDTILYWDIPLESSQRDDSNGMSQYKGFNLDHSKGTMKAFNLTTNEVWPIPIHNAPSRPDFMAAPHGMSVWKDVDTDELLVYVITHPAKEDRIEVFKMVDGNLIYTKTITDPDFAFMNDIVVVGRDMFYITKIWGFREKSSITMEVYLRMVNGAVLYYDGNTARDVCGGLLMPNGINISPDKSMIYIAQFGEKKILGYHREPTNNLAKAWELDVGTNVDNINVEPNTGDLWIGSHPLLYRVMDLYGWLGLTAPSQVLRVKIRDGQVAEVSQLYADCGNEIEGSSVALYIKGKLIIGSVFRQMIVCDVKYL